MLKIMNRAHNGMTQLALQKVTIPENAKILDVGCGGGKAINTLSKTNKTSEIYGIDYSDQAVEDSLILS